MKKILLLIFAGLIATTVNAQLLKRIIDLPVEPSIEDTDLIFVGHPHDGRLQQNPILKLETRLIDSFFNAGWKIISYGKNITDDSTVLVLSNGSRFAAFDRAGASVPTWQQTLLVANGSILTQDNTIEGADYNYTHRNVNSFKITSYANGDTLLIDDGTQKLVWNKRFIRIDTLNYRWPTSHILPFNGSAGQKFQGTAADGFVLTDTTGDGTLVWHYLPYYVNADVGFGQTYFGAGGSGGQRWNNGTGSRTYYGYRVFASETGLANNNAAFGVNIASSATTASSNDIFGTNCFFNATTATSNTAFGTYTLNGVTTQGNNVAIGGGALSCDVNNATRNTTGIVASGTTAVGINAGNGMLTANYTSTTTANNSIFIGYNNGLVAIGNSVDSTTVFGNRMKTALSNVFVLGGATQRVIIPSNTLTVTTDNFAKFQTPSIAYGYRSTATSTTLTRYDHTLEVTATGQTITLPTAVGCTGMEYLIKLTASGSTTIATTSSQLIDGASTYSLSAQYKFVRVESNNVGWLIVGSN